MKSLLRWVPSLVIMGVIFVGSSTPGQVVDNAGLGREWIHIVVHFGIFFALCVSFWWATKNVALACVLTILYGGLDELHQALTPERSPSMFDLVTDSMGAFLAAGTIEVWKKYLKIKMKPENSLQA